MFIRFIFVIVAIASVLFSSPAWPPSMAPDWTVLTTTPNVLFTLDKKEWLPVATGMKIPNKSWIDTGPRGRVTLNRGSDTINLSPGTYAGVFNLAGPIEKTVVIQQSGTVALDVTRRSAPWMMVKSPAMVALVKGTKFEVSLSEKSSQVSVSRGTVQVTDFKLGDYADINAGQSAVVDPTGVQTMVVAVTSAIKTAADSVKIPDIDAGNSAGNGNASSNPNRDMLSNWEGARDFGNVDIGTIARRSNVYFNGNAHDIFGKIDLLILAMLTIPLLFEQSVRAVRFAIKLSKVKISKG